MNITNFFTRAGLATVTTPMSAAELLTAVSGWHVTPEEEVDFLVKINASKGPVKTYEREQDRENNQVGGCCFLLAVVKCCEVPMCAPVCCFSSYCVGMSVFPHAKAFTNTHLNLRITLQKSNQITSNQSDVCVKFMEPLSAKNKDLLLEGIAPERIERAESANAADDEDDDDDDDDDGDDDEGDYDDDDEEAGEDGEEGEYSDEEEEEEEEDAEGCCDELDQ